jgi:hypothetical protein
MARSPEALLLALCGGLVVSTASRLLTCLLIVVSPTRGALYVVMARVLGSRVTAIPAIVSIAEILKRYKVTEVESTHRPPNAAPGLPAAAAAAAAWS